MTYLSYAFDNIVLANRDLAQSVAEPFDEGETKKTTAYIVTHSLVVRVAALFFSVISILTTSIVITYDLAMLNWRLLKEHGVWWPPALKVNFIYGKILTIGISCEMLSTIAPEVIYRLFNGYEALKRSIAQLLVALPQDLEALADTLDIDLTSLADYRQTLLSWREELRERLTVGLPMRPDVNIEPAHSPDFYNFHFEFLREPLREVLRNHYPESVVNEAIPQSYNFVSRLKQCFQDQEDKLNPNIRQLITELDRYSRGDKCHNIFCDPIRRLEALKTIVDRFQQVRPNSR